MKLLIITQKIDLEDSNLSFFHRWVEKFAENLDKVYVICLWEGRHNLPENVVVCSLGKEKGYSKIRQFLRLQKFVFRNIQKADGIFVHMCPIYAIAAYPLAKLLRKKIYLWYNHQAGGFITRLAVKMCDKVFYTSPFSFAARYKKSNIMPAGIDTKMFKRDYNIHKQNNSLLYLARIAPIKHLDILISAVDLLDKQRCPFSLNIIGEPGENDWEYFQKIKHMSGRLEKAGRIRFFGGIPYSKIPAVYNKNRIFINLSPSGLFDKTILEAMACETLALVSNKSFECVLPEELLFEQWSAKDLKNKIFNLFQMTDKQQDALSKKLRDYVIKNHNLDNLTGEINEQSNI